VAGPPVAVRHEIERGDRLVTRLGGVDRHERRHAADLLGVDECTEPREAALLVQFADPRQQLLGSHVDAAVPKRRDRGVEGRLDDREPALEGVEDGPVETVKPRSLVHRRRFGFPGNKMPVRGDVGRAPARVYRHLPRTQAMDTRVRTHAETIAEHSVDIGPGDDVIIRAPTVAEPLVVALHEVLGERNANPAVSWHDGRAHRAYVLASDADAFETPEHVLAFVEAADVFVDVGGAHNTREGSDVPPEKGAAFGRAVEPVGEAKMDTRWVYTAYPAPGNAQQAGMSTDAYESFVWNAINRDWDAQRERQAGLVEILEDGESVRLRVGDHTDIRMDIADNPVRNDDGRNNLPGGEVSTAPVPGSVEGAVRFERPGTVRGRKLRDVRLTFAGGDVVDFSAADNEEQLAAILETDAGSRRLGELGIGMNPDIDRRTGRTLFDEKMAGTVHLALGRAYEHSVADSNERNDSAVHRDLLLDVSEDATLAVDGEVVQRNGTFAFGDGSET